MALAIVMLRRYDVTALQIGERPTGRAVDERVPAARGDVDAIAGGTHDGGDAVGVPRIVVERQRDVEKELSSLRQAQLSTIAVQLHQSSNHDVLVTRLDGYAGEQLRSLAQELQHRGRRVVVIVGASDEKVSIAVASDGSQDASMTVKQLAVLVGGGGGGSPRLALAGGRDASGIDKVISAAAEL